MNSAEIRKNTNVPDFEEIRKYSEEKNWNALIKLFWKYGDINDGANETLGINHHVNAEPAEVFYRLFRYQYHRLKREITEKYLVKTKSLVEVLLKGTDIALCFEDTKNSDLIKEWYGTVSSFVSNRDLLTPLINTTYEHRNNGNKYYLCFSEDSEHTEESFILANGGLTDYLISFDLILEFSRDWLVKEYRNKYYEIDEEFRKRGNVGVQYVLLIIKKYGPTGTVALQGSFSEFNGGAGKWSIVKFKPRGLPFSTAKDQFLDLYGKAFAGFKANATICSMYDLIYTGEGIIRPLKATQEEIPPERYGCVVLFYDKDFPREEAQQKFLDDAIVKSIYDPQRVKNALEKRDFSPFINKHAEYSCMSGKAGAWEKPVVKDVENELLDLAYELGGINSTLMTNACYIGKKVFGIDLPDDFEPYGKLFVMSDFLSRNIHSLELKVLAGSLPDKSAENYRSKDSTLGKLGSLLKNYDKEEIRIAAVYLMRGHIQNNFSVAQRNKAEEILQKVKGECTAYFHA